MNFINRGLLFLLASFFSFNVMANEMSCEVLQKVMYCSGGAGSIFNIEGGSGNNSFKPAPIDLGLKPQQPLPQQTQANLGSFPMNALLFCAMPRSSVCCKKCGFKKYCKLWDKECDSKNQSQERLDITNKSVSDINKFNVENPNQMSQEQILQKFGPKTQ